MSVSPAGRQASAFEPPTRLAGRQAGKAPLFDASRSRDSKALLEEREKKGGLWGTILQTSSSKKPLDPRNRFLYKDPNLD
jgi:hypothetical protein